MEELSVIDGWDDEDFSSLEREDSSALRGLLIGLGLAASVWGTLATAVWAVACASAL